MVSARFRRHSRGLRNHFATTCYLRRAAKLVSTLRFPASLSRYMSGIFRRKYTLLYKKAAESLRNKRFARVYICLATTVEDDEIVENGGEGSQCRDTPFISEACVYVKAKQGCTIHCRGMPMGMITLFWKKIGMPLLPTPCLQSDYILRCGLGSKANGGMPKVRKTLNFVPRHWHLSFGCHIHPSFAYGTTGAPFGLSRCPSLVWKHFVKFSKFFGHRFDRFGIWFGRFSRFIESAEAKSRIFINRMNQLGTGSTSSALWLANSVSHEEYLIFLCLVLTRPGSKLSVVAFV
uniref:Uncharacterized protein n=1 Tax=Vitis vinifera TaxID=29760 RepID=A5BKA5_VITVI|nr:hypothetical protein VITISV_016512 [Vitis vinifera]